MPGHAEWQDLDRHYTRFSDEEAEEGISGLPKAAHLAAAESGGWLGPQAC